MRIVLRPPLRHRRNLHQPPQQRHRARRGRHQHARAPPQSQPQLQIVPALLRMPPLGDLVAPGDMMLGPAQFLRIGPRIEPRLRPGCKAHQPLALVKAHRLARPRHAQHAALPGHHHLHRILDRRPHQSDAQPAIRSRQPGNPLRPRPRLPKAAPGQHQPYRPIPRRRRLPGMQPCGPEFEQGSKLLHRQPPHHIEPILRRRVGQPVDGAEQRLMVVHHLPAPFAPRFARLARRDCARSSSFSRIAAVSSFSVARLGPGCAPVRCPSPR